MPKEPAPDVDVDRFDDACERATQRAAVLRELAAAKESGDTFSDECAFWGGVRALTEDIAADLETMRTVDTEQANYIFSLENRRRPGKDERRNERQGGAR